jgi:CheY-like chemotaxis protein
VRETVDLVAPLTAPRQIALTTDTAAMEERYVHADRQRLKQVLLNLVANAIKYNRPGGRVRIGCAPVAGDRVRLIVADTGIGIAADKLARLFTPFDRLGAEQSDVDGTGLGLALSRRLAEAMGGTIGVTSEMGAGTTFWVELPGAENPLARLDRIAPEPEPSSKPRAARPTRTVLYVEDNVPNLTLVQRILSRHHDIELIPAMQGGLALELIRLHRPDLVLLDLHLPDIPGDEVLKQLRAAADCRDIPVVVLSADATPRQIERMLAAGAHAYVTKPLEVKPFLDIVNEVLKPERAA